MRLLVVVCFVISTDKRSLLLICLLALDLARLVCFWLLVDGFLLSAARWVFGLVISTDKCSYYLLVGCACLKSVCLRSITKLHYSTVLRLAWQLFNSAISSQVLRILLVS